MRSSPNGTGWELKLDLNYFTDFSFKLREFMYENVPIGVLMFEQLGYI
jgi:hypothetical protein